MQKWDEGALFVALFIGLALGGVGGFWLGDMAGMGERERAAYRQGREDAKRDILELMDTLKPEQTPPTAKEGE